MTTITLCERELADYMLRMTGEKGSIALFSENGASFLEEHYTIDVTGGRGSIRANRPRALLLGIYDFLRRCGCRFLRPGKTGEVIPRVPLESIDVHAEVSPASRHRGFTIEAPSLWRTCSTSSSGRRRPGSTATLSSSARRLSSSTAGIRMPGTI